MEQENRNEINQEISNGFLMLKGQGVDWQEINHVAYLSVKVHPTKCQLFSA